MCRVLIFFCSCFSLHESTIFSGLSPSMLLIVLWLLLHFSLNWCSLHILPLDSKTSNKSVCSISDYQLKSSWLFCQQTIFVQLCFLIIHSLYWSCYHQCLSSFFPCPIFICCFTIFKTSVHVVKVCSFCWHRMAYALCSPLTSITPIEML